MLLITKGRPRVAVLASLALFALFGCTRPAMADMLTFSGVITQSTQNGTGPAVNNTSLNSIMDGDAFTVILNFTGGIGGPGVYPLTGASFDSPAHGASESSFDFALPTGITIVPNGTFDDFSILICLTTGTACDVSNQLDANFRIPAADLNSTSGAIALDQPHPLDLLEDDGITDIHGDITNYSYTGPTAVPEPSSLVLLGIALAAIGRELRQKKQLPRARSLRS